KLTLSQADNQFFKATISSEDMAPERPSHEIIENAWKRLNSFINTDVLNGHGVAGQATRLQQLVNGVLAIDCTAIFMCSDTRREAYQIFQVLNDRGVHLTDGDLLRSSTMELLDDPKLQTIQNELADYWDRVLAYTPNDIDDYLRWYFSSYEGKRPKSSNLSDQFMQRRFAHKKASIVSKAEAKRVLAEVKQMDADFSTLRAIGDGEWPYSSPSKVVEWDRKRLKLLVEALRHTNAMPLLLSLCQLTEKKFAEAVALLERFVFRYKTVGGAHASPMTSLYINHAKQIRDASKYTLTSLKSDLRALANKSVPDSIFEAKMRELAYSPRGNWHIRYLLIVLEDYHQWYDKGAHGAPKCLDKMRVFDFSNTTLEHIYPDSATQGSKVAGLERLKHTVGNLTLLGPGDNNKLANKPFAAKRKLFSKSGLKLNRDIAKKTTWTATHVKQRSTDIVKMALKIFEI
ncbi:MAG: HNH endonuclease family protein, partial [Planctomycetota bacterium]